ncbi:Sterol uptake control protein [Lachnellula suecica]|uniref:Sterol uptake control protein n=1 Tax=Lachnellula suecica TaxID=602035 RepID=A0A8T9BZR6_9HELO|nr:Sterol uptake control protein [Lachnellula suecica]
MFNVARRSHRKVRTGCRTCKRRKIKCDEGRPSCWNCIKHSVTCDFLPSSSSSGGTPKSQGYATTPSPQTNPSFVRETGVWAAPGIGLPYGSESGELPELNIHDLELLHHFTVSTALSMTADTVVRTLWRTKIPQIAFQHRFLMRGMLAISALHLSHVHPEKRDFYFPYSMKHHQMALTEGTFVLGNVTQDNCAALHIFSILTTMHTVGRPRRPQDFLVVGESGIAKWLVLFRGTLEIIEPFIDSMASGPLAALFQARLRRQRLRDISMTEEQADHLHEIRALVLQATSENLQLSEMYAQSLDDLQASFTFVYNSAPHTYETGDVFRWLLRVCDEYLQLLKDGAQEALTIFAYSCVLFKKTECYWWMEGWSSQLMSNIHRHLDEEHRMWIQWPIEEIGWVET